MHFDQLARPRSVPHQQQHPVRAPIERKHLALLHDGYSGFTGLDDFIFAGVTILNPDFHPTIDHRYRAFLFMNQLA